MTAIDVSLLAVDQPDYPVLVLELFEEQPFEWLRDDFFYFYLNFIIKNKTQLLKWIIIKLKVRIVAPVKGY